MTSGSIWLVRHAATAWTGERWCGRSDPALSPVGELEAAELARRIAGRLTAVPTIVSSPARRALDTARCVANAIGAGTTPTVDPELAEVDLGVIDGLTFDALAVAYPAVAARLLAGDIEIDWPDGETASAVRTRASCAWTRLALAADQVDVVVITHGAFISALLARAGAAARPGPLRPAGAIRLTPHRSAWFADVDPFGPLVP